MGISGSRAVEWMIVRLPEGVTHRTSISSELGQADWAEGIGSARLEFDVLAGYAVSRFSTALCLVSWAQVCQRC